MHLFFYLFLPFNSCMLHIFFDFGEWHTDSDYFDKMQPALHSSDWHVRLRPQTAIGNEKRLFCLAFVIILWILVYYFLPFAEFCSICFCFLNSVCAVSTRDIQFNETNGTRAFLFVIVRYTLRHGHNINWHVFFLLSISLSLSLSSSPTSNQNIYIASIHSEMPLIVANWFMLHRTEVCSGRQMHRLASEHDGKQFDMIIFLRRRCQRTTSEK